MKIYPYERWFEDGYQLYEKKESFMDGINAKDRTLCVNVNGKTLYAPLFDKSAYSRGRITTIVDGKTYKVPKSATMSFKTIGKALIEVHSSPSKATLEMQTSDSYRYRIHNNGDISIDLAFLDKEGNYINSTDGVSHSRDYSIWLWCDHYIRTDRTVKCKSIPYVVESNDYGQLPLANRNGYHSARARFSFTKFDGTHTSCYSTSQGVTEGMTSSTIVTVGMNILGIYIYDETLGSGFGKNVPFEIVHKTMS